jgi:hypothetical protein
MANPDYTVEIVGYADKLTGSSKRNMQVSKSRVEGVQKMMVKLGVPADRISSNLLLAPLSKIENHSILLTLFSTTVVECLFFRSNFHNLSYNTKRLKL